MTAMVPVATDVGNRLVRHCRWPLPSPVRVLRQHSRQIAALAPGVRHSFLLGSDSTLFSEVASLFLPRPGSEVAACPG